MPLLPALRSGTLTRPGSQVASRWDPFGELEDLYGRMGQLLDATFGGQSPAQAWSPPADLSETEDAYIAEVELPGVKKDDIGVEVSGQELSITGEYRQAEAEGRALHRARRAGRFEYRVTLPVQVNPDKITAALADGVLTVTVPKAETDKPRRIAVTAG